MLADKALDLIKELRRSPDYLQPLREDTIREILEEMAILFRENQQDVDAAVNSDVELHTTIHVRHIILTRMKRCLLAYLHNRLMHIKEMRWAFGSVLTSDVKANMSEQEQQWFQKYSSNLTNYMSSIGGGVGLDLTKYLHPPKSLYVQVRCLSDYGDFETEDGSIINLTKNSTHYMERSQCEKLIHQGILEHVT
ncbi:DNA replication complex GINS protein PSF1-like [Ornithodoros turicata]|uniref:DNA replication complex GINS protein PSF1-like n=1 Tax=Ornithodoros turicata TaxID=34597 RepID=UPI00313A2881